jgi:hypothetical protein
MPLGSSVGYLLLLVEQKYRFVDFEFKMGNSLSLP